MQPVIQTALNGRSASPAIGGMRAAHASPLLRPQTITQATIAGIGMDQARQHTLDAKDKGEQRVIGIFDKISSIGFAPMLLGLVTTGLAFVTTLGSRPDSAWRAKVYATLKPALKALEHTEIASLGSGRLTHEFQKERQILKARGGIADAKRVAKIKEQAVKFHAQDLERLTGNAPREVKPSTLTGGLGWLEKNTIRRFANWRAKAAETRAAEQLGGATQHLTKAPEQGFLGRLFRRRFTPVDLSSYKATATALGGVAEKSGAELTRGVLAQTQVIERELMGSIKGQTHLHGAKAVEALRNTRVDAGLAQSWRDTAKGGFAHLVKNLPKSVGRISVLNAGLVLGTLGLIGSKIFTTKRENRLSNVALTDFAADVYGVPASQVTSEMLTGKGANPLVVQAASAGQKNCKGRAAYGAISNVAEVAGMATMRSSGGMLLMPYYMFGDKAIKELLVAEHNPLQAYQILKQAELGKAEIEPAQRQQMVGALIATIPGIAHQGGIDNRLIRPMAAELMLKNLTVAELVQTIASPEKMQALAESVKAKLPTPKAAAATVPAPAILHDTLPKGKVSAVGLDHQGRVNTPQIVATRG
jgi:hypothetical protein